MVVAVLSPWSGRPRPSATGLTASGPDGFLDSAPCWAAGSLESGGGALRRAPVGRDRPPTLPARVDCSCGRRNPHFRDGRPFSAGRSSSAMGPDSRHRGEAGVVDERFSATAAFRADRALLPFVRSAVPFVAGASQMTFRSFLPLSIGGNPSGPRVLSFVTGSTSPRTRCRGSRLVGPAAVASVAAGLTVRYHDGGETLRAARVRGPYNRVRSIALSHRFRSSRPRPVTAGPVERREARRIATRYYRQRPDGTGFWHLRHRCLL